MKKIDGNILIRIKHVDDVFDLASAEKSVEVIGVYDEPDHMADSILHGAANCEHGDRLVAFQFNADTREVQVITVVIAAQDWN